MIWKHSLYRRAERINKQSNPGDRSFMPVSPVQNNNLAQQVEQIQNKIHYSKCETVMIKM